ncbi:RHS repeat-associated core domain-containing protein [Pseudomonas fluorescens]|uniref:RHS repeat-associated core domain-containing protein n=1 Tax=Pseudomonas fluorescens TaxID=294 RepID=UPI0009B8406C|nr:RHS repeat-associated core domain-containing protein [Pseudomonas fluorescens]
MNHTNTTQQRTVLLATDDKNSVIAEVVGDKTTPMAYSAYGHQSAQQDVVTRLGFNGELREAQIGWYLLGNGHRAYNPRLMRFHSPDSWSPFGEGGLNAYAYCSNDPTNSKDPTGHIRLKIIPTRSLIRRPPVIVQNPQRHSVTTPTPPRSSVIVENPKISPPKPTDTQENSVRSLGLTISSKALPRSASTGAIPISSSTILDAIKTPISSTSLSKQNVSAMHSGASAPQQMPKLEPIGIHKNQLPPGKRRMPTLPISASEQEIKKIRWLNPSIRLIRGS